MSATSDNITIVFGGFLLSSSYNMIKAIFSDRMLARLYDERKALRPSEENRNYFSLSVTVTLFSAVLIYLLSQAWLRQDVGNYLKAKTSIIYLRACGRTHACVCGCL